MARKVCARPGCPHFQPCPEGHNAPWAGSNRRAELPKDWAKVRRRILRRDPTCTACHAAPSTDVDHIGDKHDHRDTNLRGLCSACHASRTGRQGAAGRYGTTPDHHTGWGVTPRQGGRNPGGEASRSPDP